MPARRHSGVFGGHRSAEHPPRPGSPLRPDVLSVPFVETSFRTTGCSTPASRESTFEILMHRVLDASALPLLSTAPMHSLAISSAGRSRSMSFRVKRFLQGIDQGLPSRTGQSSNGLRGGSSGTAESARPSGPSRTTLSEQATPRMRGMNFFQRSSAECNRPRPAEAGAPQPDSGSYPMPSPVGNSCRHSSTLYVAIDKGRQVALDRSRCHRQSTITDRLPGIEPTELF